MEIVTCPTTTNENIITQSTTTQKLIQDLQWKQGETLASIAEKISCTLHQLQCAVLGEENEEIFARLFGLWCRNYVGLAKNLQINSEMAHTGSINT